MMATPTESIRPDGDAEKDGVLKITPDGTPPDTRPSLMVRKFMAADANAEEAQADWDC